MRVHAFTWNIIALALLILYHAPIIYNYENDLVLKSACLFKEEELVLISEKFNEMF